MNVYFTASTQSVKDLKEIYTVILQELEKNECTNLNLYIQNCVSNKKLREKIQSHPKTEESIYSNSLKLIGKSHFVIAETTYPSITIGRQIEYAIQKNIPVLCLFNGTQHNNISSSFIDYQTNTQTFRLYDKTNIDFVLKSYIGEFKKTKNRFNLFLSKEHDKFLTILAKREGINKSDVVRKLIEKEILQIEKTS